MTESLDPTGLLLPQGARLVHIGPSKTGTTSLQGAMWAARHELRPQGVHYAGRSRHSGFAARAVAGRKSAYSDEGAPPPIRHWEAIVREVAKVADARVVFSSEFLAHAKPDAIRRVVDDLGGDRVHIAVTLRPLAKMLASRWQQDIQAGDVKPIEKWMEGHLGREGDVPDVAMWTAHRHDRLIATWAEAVGIDHVTAVVVDERDHAFVLRAFEALVGLRPGTLEIQEDYQNRSLLLQEAEALRLLNIRTRELGLGRRANTIIVRDGAARTMKLRKPGPDEPRIAPPRWAVERAGEIAQLVVAGIRSTGVRVVGNLDSLAVVPEAVEPPAYDGRLPAEAAVAMAIGTVRSAGALPAPPKGSAAAAERRQLDHTKILPMHSDLDLVKLLLRRQRMQTSQFVKRIRGKGGADA